MLLTTNINIEAGTSLIVVDPFGCACITERATDFGWSNCRSAGPGDGQKCRPPDAGSLPDVPPLFCGDENVAQRGAMNIAIQEPSAVREALEAVARELETRAGNVVYMQAWKRAAKIIRARIPQYDIPTDGAPTA